MDFEFEIREGTPTDVEAIARVHVDVWRATYPGIVPDAHLRSLSYEKRAEGWRKNLARSQPPYHLFVALDSSGQIVGFSDGGPNRGEPSYIDGEIYAIYLRPEYQGRGVGERLLRASLERLAADDFRDAMAWVLEANPTRFFYQKMGGNLIGGKVAEIGGAKLKELGYGWSLSTAHSASTLWRVPYSPLALPAILEFLETGSGGRIDRERGTSLVTQVVSGAEAIQDLRIGKERVGVGIIVDTCDNNANSADLILCVPTGPHLTAVAEYLLAWGEARLLKSSRSALDIAIFDDSTIPADLLLQRGYQIAYGLYEMSGEGREPGRPKLPDSLRWSDLEEKWLSLYYETVRLAFADIPGASVPEYHVFASRCRASPIPPRLLLKGDSVAGVLRVELRPSGAGEIILLGRHPAHRGEGLGPYLLKEAMRLLWERGARRFQLEVAATNRKAIRLYEGEGFSSDRTTSVYRLPRKKETGK